MSSVSGAGVVPSKTTVPVTRALGWREIEIELGVMPSVDTSADPQNPFTAGCMSSEVAMGGTTESLAAATTRYRPAFVDAR